MMRPSRCDPITNSYGRRRFGVVPAGLLERLLSALFPFACLGCGAELPFTDDQLGLCARCRRHLPWPGSSICPRCGEITAAGGRVCGRCRRRPPPYQGLVFGLRYEPPVIEVVRALKFGGADFLGFHLGALLAARHGPELAAECDLVTPVPLAWPRLLARGYNQAEAISRSLAAHLGLPHRRLLRRAYRRPQSRRGLAARRRAQRGAFSLSGTLGCGQRVLLVDDVTTTGATLEAATIALLAGGSTRVVCAVAARTPRRSPSRRR